MGSSNTQSALLVPQIIVLVLSMIFVSASVSVATLLKMPKCNCRVVVFGWFSDSKSAESHFSTSDSCGEAANTGRLDPKQLSVLLREDFPSLVVERSPVLLLCSASFVLLEHLWNSGRNVARLAAMMPKAPSTRVQIKGNSLLL